MVKYAKYNLYVIQYRMRLDELDMQMHRLRSRRVGVWRKKFNIY